MMSKNLMLPLVCLLFSAVAHAQDADTGRAAPADDKPLGSRLRMFGQNGAMATLFKGSACVKSAWSADAEKVSGGIGSAFGSMFGAVSNISLGMAETETSRNLSKKDGILSKAYFREYVVPAGKPSSMRMGFKDIASFYTVNGVHYGGCHGAITFTPEAGEDYEAAFIWEGRVCRLSVNHVIASDGEVKLTPVPVTPAPDC